MAEIAGTNGAGEASVRNRVLTGDARSLLGTLPAGSVDLSFWSPPYHVGKSWEEDATFPEWGDLLRDVIAAHTRILKPGCFLVVNIGDILCFADPAMPRMQAHNVGGKRSPVTAEQIHVLKARQPELSRHQLAAQLGCSEQTIQRRIEHNNVRGGKSVPSTKIKLTGGMVAEWAEAAGLYLHDQRIWRKDPSWANSRWHSVSYRAVDEFEHLYVFWRPGITTYDRNRLTPEEWSAWGSRGVWDIPSVRRNGRHEAEFPEELARRVIQLFSPPGGVVLDPFLGSGTTAVVAKQLGRQWVGIEKDPRYAALARSRIQCTLI